MKAGQQIELSQPLHTASCKRLKWVTTWFFHKGYVFEELLKEEGLAPPL